MANLPGVPHRPLGLLQVCKKHKNNYSPSLYILTTPDSTNIKALTLQILWAAWYLNKIGRLVHNEKKGIVSRDAPGTGKSNIRNRNENIRNPELEPESDNYVNLARI